MESPHTEADALAHLDALGIPYSLHRHDPVFTVQEAQAVRIDMPGGHCKNLFLRDKKKNQLLIVAEENTRIRLNDLADLLGFKRLSFGSADRLKAVLGVMPGSVTPLSLINCPIAAGETPELQVILDEALLSFKTIYCHPLHNAATIGISPDDLLKFIESTGYTPHIQAFSGA